MISRIRLNNYGPFKNTTLKLGPFTVLVGPNASGKSIALAALHKLVEASSDTAQDELTSMRRRGSERSTVGVSFLTYDENHGMIWRLSGNGKFSRKQELENRPTVLLIRLEPAALRRASYSEDLEPALRSDGYGLATVLESMILRRDGVFPSLLKCTKAIVPTFEDLRVKRARVENDEGQAVIGHELVIDMKRAPDLPASAASDGTLFTLGLLAMLMGDSTESAGSKLILIDEIERGLHPKALGELVRQLRKLTSELDVQILATSHSPYLVDWLEPGEVRLTRLLDDGTATIRSLTDHPDFERWKEEMSPGEFWSTVGEDWNP